MFTDIWFRVVVVVASLVASAAAQSWPVGLNSTLQWAVPVVGANPLGGLLFADSSQLVIVGGSDSPQGAAYNYVPIRDPGTGRITGLSPSGVVGPTPNADSGLEVFGGLLFYSRYGDNKVGEYNPVTDTTWIAALPP